VLALLVRLLADEVGVAAVALATVVAFVFAEPIPVAAGAGTSLALLSAGLGALELSGAAVLLLAGSPEGLLITPTTTATIATATAPTPTHFHGVGLVGGSGVVLDTAASVNPTNGAAEDAGSTGSTMCSVPLGDFRPSQSPDGSVGSIGGAKPRLGISSFLGGGGTDSFMCDSRPREESRAGGSTPNANASSLTKSVALSNLLPGSGSAARANQPSNDSGSCVPSVAARALARSIGPWASLRINACWFPASLASVMK